MTLWPRQVAQRWAGVVLYILAVVTTVTLYGRALHGPLVLDDYPSLEPLLALSRLPPDWSHYVMSPTGPLGRPVSMLSFLANLALTGPDLWAWKATNLALHCLVGVLIFDLSRRLLVLTLECKDRALLVAAFLAALWLLHPSHPSTVLYTVQRMTILSTLFTAAGIDLYLCGRLSEHDNRVARCAMWGAYLICLPLAALAKETGLLLPGYLWVLELTVLKGLGPQSLLRQTRWLSLVFCIAPMVSGAIYCTIHVDRLFLAPNLLRGWSMVERLLTEARVIVHYLGQVVIPSRSMFGFFHDDISVSRGLFSPLSTVLSVLFLATLWIVGWISRRRAPLFACGVLWFFVAHALESTIFPLELMFEHRNYFACFGILLAVVGIIIALPITHDVRISCVGGASIFILFALVTASITRDWQDDVSLFTSSYQLHPKSPNAASALAELLTERQRFHQALVVLRDVPVAGARLQEAYIKCQRDGRLVDNELSTALLDAEPVLSMYAVTGMVELAKLGLDKDCIFPPQQIIQLLAAAVHRPMIHTRNRFLLHFYSAHYQWELGRSNLALASLDAAKRADPSDPMPLFLASGWLNQLGRRDAGLNALAEGREIAARSGKDYSSIINSVAALYAVPPRG